MIQLPEDFAATERGNTFLLSGDGAMVAWFNIENYPRRLAKIALKKLLEVSWTPGNYPELKVQVVEMTDEQLAHHIKTNCQAWTVRKCNIEGVDFPDGIVPITDEE